MGTYYKAVVETSNGMVVDRDPKGDLIPVRDRRDFFWDFEAAFFLPKAYEVAMALPSESRGVESWAGMLKARNGLSGKPSDETRWFVNEPLPAKKTDGSLWLDELDLYRITHVVSLYEMERVLDQIRVADADDVHRAEVVGFEAYVRAVLAAPAPGRASHYRVLWASD